MEILVTGGAGFIGGNIAEALIRDGHNVTVVDNFDPFYDVGIKQKTVERCETVDKKTDGAYTLVRGDIRDAGLIGDLVSDVEVVIHQAAQAGVRNSVKNPRGITQTNVGGTVNILQSAVDADVERVILASSSSVYGKPVYLPYDEEHPNEPVSPYGVSKLAQEHYARVFQELHSLSTVCLRYFTVYGPRMRPNMAISNFVSRCANGEPPIIYGDGKQTRDFTYVDDVVEANRTLLETDTADGEILNIGSTDNITITRLAKEVRDQLAPELDIVYEDAREADAEHTHANVSKARGLIDYEPTYNIDNGVELFIEWYQQNTEWYEPLVRSS